MKAKRESNMQYMDKKVDSHNYLQVSPLCKISWWFQPRTEGGGDKMSPPPFKETKKSKRAMSSSDLALWKEKKNFLRSASFNNSPMKVT